MMMVQLMGNKMLMIKVLLMLVAVMGIMMTMMMMVMDDSHLLKHYVTQIGVVHFLFTEWRVPCQSGKQGIAFR